MLQSRSQQTQHKRGSNEAIANLQSTLNCFFAFQQKQREKYLARPQNIKPMTHPEFKQRVKSQATRAQVVREQLQQHVQENRWNQEHQLDNAKFLEMQSSGYQSTYKFSPATTKQQSLKQRTNSLKQRFSQRSHMYRPMTQPEGRVGQLHGRRLQLINNATTPIVSNTMKVQQARANSYARNCSVPSTADYSQSQHSFKQCKPVHNNYTGEGAGEYPKLSQTFYLPCVKSEPMKETSGESSSERLNNNSSYSARGNFENNLKVLDLPTYSTQRNLSATMKKSEQLRTIGDISIRSMHLENSSQGSRRVIQIARVDSDQGTGGHENNDDASSCGTLVDDSPDGGSRLLPVISCLDSTISSEI